MPLRNSCVDAWRRLLKSLRRDRRSKALETLRREYADEMESSLRLEWHAERMRYPQFCERLLRIAKEEQRHAQWLARRIAVLGGSVPAVSFTPDEGRNSWQRLREDLEAEKSCCANLTEELALEKNIDPITTAVLRRILADEQIHREEIAEMLIRSDPQADS